MEFLRYFAAHRAEIMTAMFEHFWLVAVAIFIAAAVGIPLGIVLTRRPAWGKLVLGSANIVQTVPSLALFGLLLPLPWLGAEAARLAIAALTLYALLPIIRNTYVGIAGLDPAVVEAGQGMGMTGLQLLAQVQLPLALPVIIAGLRVATVISIGVATIAAAVGAGGLGEYIFRGVAMVDNRLIFAGAIPAAGLAILADVLLGLVERTLRSS